MGCQMVRFTIDGPLCFLALRSGGNVKQKDR